MNASQRRETDLQSTAPQQTPLIALQQQDPPDLLAAYQFNLADLKTNYKTSHSTWRREAFKYVFSIATFGLGALYLWATTLVVKKGEVAMRRNARGEMILLPPGRHSNFPWEAYVSQKLAPPSPSLNRTPVQRNSYAELKKMGIKLLSISTTGRTIDDPALAHELGQVAVIQAKARSTMLAAAQAKQVKEIEAEAEANAMRARAKGQADAVKEIGTAFFETAESMKENPTAAQFFIMDLQKSWFANNPNLLFNIGGGNQATMPIMLSSGTGFGMGRGDN